MVVVDWVKSFALIFYFLSAISLKLCLKMCGAYLEFSLYGFNEARNQRLIIASEASNLVGWVAGCCGWWGEISIWAKPLNIGINRS
jgi:hypothetical protein